MAFLTDLNGTPVAGETVTVSRTGSGYFGESPGSSSFQGTTDSAGKVTTTFTPTSCQSNPVLTASVSHCSTAEVSKTVRVLCETPTTVDIWFCIDVSASMGFYDPVPHYAHDSIVELVQDLQAADVPLRLGGVKFNEQYPTPHIIVSGEDKQEYPLGELSVSSYIGSSFLNNNYFGNSTFTELQLTALDHARLDTVAKQDSDRLQYIVLVTDEEPRDPNPPYTKEQLIPLLENSGAAVYLSIWEHTGDPSPRGPIDKSTKA